MRLAFCNATRRWGGVKTWTIEFAAALEQRGHKAFLYGRDEAFIERACEKGLEARLVNFGMDYNPASVARFYADFRKKGIQALLVNVGKDMRTAGLAARLAGIPIVRRIGLPGDIKNSLQVRLEHHLLAPHYLCPCEYIRKGMLKELPFLRGEDSSVVYSAKEPLTRPTPAHRPLRFISTSQVNANKGQMELARTLAVLLDEGFRLSWDVAGEGNSLEALKALVARLGLAPWTVFHGFTQNVSTLLAQADVFVLSSYTEGLPNTLLEGMAAGLVPVARNVGGVAESWPSSLAPLLVPEQGWEKTTDWRTAEVPGDRVQERLPLYNALKKVLTASDAEVQHWKQEAMEHLRTNFSLAVQAEKLEAFFESLLQISAT